MRVFPETTTIVNVNQKIDGQELYQRVRRLRDAVQASSLQLNTPNAEADRRARAELLDQLDDYVLPRLASLDAPLLAVVGGSTGAGKSTLVNSIVGEKVTTSGVLRPTTRASVLIHHPDDTGWFASDRILPNLARLTSGAAPGVGDDPSSLRLVKSASVPKGLALLDAPDIDSVVSANRDLANQLLAAADLWLFVTTAVRYADAVPWQALEKAIERGTSVAIVLDRVPRDSMEEVRADLARMLAAQGLGQSPVFAVAETPLDEEGLLPNVEVERISRWLHSLAGDALSRQVVIRRTLDGALDSLDARALATAQACDAQQAALKALHDSADEAYAKQRDAVRAGLMDGTLLRGEVLARWQEFVGTGEIFKQFEAGVSSLRDRITGIFKARTTPVSSASNDLGGALKSGIVTLVTSHAESAAMDAARAWRAETAGREFIQANQLLGRASADLHPNAEKLVRHWQDDVLAMVRDEAGDKRTTARFLAFGVNGIAVVLMLFTFASTAGLTGAEIGIAGGSAVVAQRLLEAIFGDQAVRKLSERARDMLMKRVDALFADERARFDEELVAFEDAGLQGNDIREAARLIKEAR